MLSDFQKKEIIERTLKVFERQFGVKRNPSDMVLSIDKPNNKNLCSIYVASKSDQFRVKLNLARMDVVTTIRGLKNSQLQGYGPGKDDEIYVGEIELAKREHIAFYNYLKSPKFLKEVVEDIDMVIDADDVQVIGEEGLTIILEDEGV